MVKRRMAQVQDEIQWGKDDLVGCWKKEKRKTKKDYPGKSISKVLKPTAGSGLVAKSTLPEWD